MKTKKILLSLFVLSLFVFPNPSLAQESEEVFRAQLQAQIDVLFQKVVRLMTILAERNDLESEEKKPEYKRPVPFPEGPDPVGVEDEKEDEQNNVPTGMIPNPDYDARTCQYLRASRRGFATEVTLEKIYCQEFIEDETITPTPTPVTPTNCSGFSCPASA